MPHSRARQRKRADTVAKHDGQAPKGYRGMHRERRDFASAEELRLIEAAEKMERERILRERVLRERGKK